MSTTHDPIAHAALLLREAAQELKQAHTIGGIAECDGTEPEVQAVYDDHMAAAAAIEEWERAIGAGGVGPLSKRECLHQIAEPARGQAGFEAWWRDKYPSFACHAPGVWEMAMHHAAPQAAPPEPAPVAVPKTKETASVDMRRVFLVVQHHASKGKPAPVYGHSLFDVVSAHASLDLAERARSAAEDAYHEDFPGYRRYGDQPMRLWAVQPMDVVGSSAAPQEHATQLAGQGQEDARDPCPVWLQVDAGVRYWEDAKVNGVRDFRGDLIPMRTGERWTPMIRLSDGFILGWPHGTRADVHYKVCDDGEYFLLDAAHKRVAKYESDYVPDLLAVGDDGYGDYIILTVSENGCIVGWTAASIDAEQWPAIVAARAAQGDAA